MIIDCLCLWTIIPGPFHKGLYLSIRLFCFFHCLVYGSSDKQFKKPSSEIAVVSTWFNLNYLLFRGSFVKLKITFFFFLPHLLLKHQFVFNFLACCILWYIQWIKDKNFFLLLLLCVVGFYEAYRKEFLGLGCSLCLYIFLFIIHRKQFCLKKGLSERCNYRTSWKLEFLKY